jgi:hypothetical protein
MMNQTLANVAILLAMASSTTFLVPQIVKLLRTRDSEGVSATWPALGFVINIGWFVYLVSQQLWISILAPFVTFVSYGVIVWALRRTGRVLSRSYTRGVVGAVTLIAVGSVGGWKVLGVVLGVSYGIMLAPSIWTAYRTVIPSGISPLTWWIGLLEALLWGYYGWFHSDQGILTFMVVGVVGSGLMLIRYYSTRKRLVEAPVASS